MKSDTNYELLLSSISHELRNPVTLIQSYLQLLAADHPEVCRYEYWDTILDEVRHLCRLLEDLSAFHNGLRIRRQDLDFKLWLSDYAQKAAVFLRRIPINGMAYTPTKQENGTISSAAGHTFYEYSDYRAYAAVAETSAYDSGLSNDSSDRLVSIPEFSEATPEYPTVIPFSSKSLSAHPEIRFSCRIAPDLPALSIDPDKLQQVLDNLIRNAAEAHANQITLSACQKTDQIILEISDNGDGIAPENLPQLFTPFVSHKPEGTGLGLAIAERIIKAHHGTITVHSVPHYMTVFRISLPVKNV